LRRRAQQLSEKAKENVRQGQEAQGKEIMNDKQAAEAVAAVEHVMEHLHDYESMERKAKQAQAALAWFQQQEPNDALASRLDITSMPIDNVQQWIDKAQDESV
jgi:Holliday junction resolvase-like predicted endonuclease